MTTEPDAHVLKEIIRIALHHDWAFYAVAQCVSKTFAQLARELAQEHPAPQSLNFVPDMLAPLPPSDAFVYKWGDVNTRFHKTLSFKTWQPFHYPVVDWTAITPHQKTAQWMHIYRKRWSMLRTSVTIHVRPLLADRDAQLLSMWRKSFLEALVFHSKPQNVQLWVNGQLYVCLEPDSNGIVWLNMLPAACCLYSTIWFATKEPADLRLIHHQCWDDDPYTLSQVIEQEFGPGPWSFTLGNVDFFICHGQLVTDNRRGTPVRSWTSAFRHRLRHALDDVCT